jgi:uncharacterized protein involved in type VI secretion and phage assembly
VSASALFDSVSRIARHEAAARAIASVGKVIEVFPADDTQHDHAVSIELRDAGLVVPRVPISVGALGFCAVPSVGDLVVVVFLEGDPNAPIVVGRLYHPDLDPPKHAEGQLVLALPPGADEPKVHLQVSGPDASILLTIAGDQEMAIECGKEKAEMRVGDMKVTVDGAGGGRTEVVAGSAKITIKKDGDIAISTDGNLKIEANEVEISGSSKVKITGAEVDIN